ncbi:hypothetical protein HDV01_001538 [Terramyces sp. JEL0728]|nr:hypothetical protein HDV01_001538 [Terramyces sp. JEL0728]
MSELKDIVIVQEPVQGREAGLKKPYISSLLHPTLILQAVFKSPPTYNTLKSQNLICNLVLYSPEMDETQSVVANSYYSKQPYTTNFFGCSSTNSCALIDPQTNIHNLYFIFPDIHVKTAGEYRLLCQVCSPENPAKVISKFTRPFKILRRPDFEKPKSITELSAAFEDQGAEAKYSSQDLSQIKINQIVIQDMDFFGPRIGFIKFKVDMAWLDGTPLPGIVFCRGDAVAILVILKSPDMEKVVMVQQPRVPIGSMGFLELPAGMLDDSNSFVGTAAQELKEETGLAIEHDELFHLNTLAPSPGGCDEYLGLYYVEKHMETKEILELEGKICGLREHGERISLKLVDFDELYSSTSMPVLAAAALYNKLKNKL